MDDLLRFAGHLRIAHHIPGRIRLKLAAELEAGDRDAVADAKRFGLALSGAPGIRSVSLNPLARSCAVEYDPKTIPPSAWQDLLSGARSAAADILLKTFQTAAGTGPKLSLNSTG